MLFDDIAHAVIVEKRRLLATRSIAPLSLEEAEETKALERRPVGKVAPSFRTEQVDAMLRVELDQHLDQKMWDSLRDRPTEALAFMDHCVRGTAKGPWTIANVAVYLVRSLPAPGWRIINPMRAQA